MTCGFTENWGRFLCAALLAAPGCTAAQDMPATPAAPAEAAEEAGIAPVPRPGPAPEIDLAELRAARQRGVAFLVGHQNPDGSWGGPRRTKQLNVAARTPGAHHAFTTATTALAIEALWLDPRRGREAEKALDRAETWLLDFLPRVKRVSGDQLYNNWAHAYSIHALLALRQRAAGNPRRQDQLLAAVADQVKRLAAYEYLDGGWGYYNHNFSTAVPSGSPTSFTTATCLIALHAARKAGAEPPDGLAGRAITSLLRQRVADGAYVYSLPHHKVPRRGINRPAGSLGRAPACNAALRLWTGREHISDGDIADWLDRLITRGEWLNIARKTPKPHESYFQNSGYFCYYGYYYAGRCMELIDPAQAAPRCRHLINTLLQQQEPDGCWWDYPLYDYHYAYGTAYVLSALARMEIEKL